MSIKAHLGKIIALILLSTTICILSPFALLFVLTFLPLHLWLHPFTEHQHPAHLGQKTAAIVYQTGKIILAPIWFPLFATTALSLIFSLWLHQIWTGKH